MTWKFGDVLESVGAPDDVLIMFIGGEELSDRFYGIGLLDEDDEADWTGQVLVLAVEDWTPRA